jgi:hypothetical protein
VTLVMVGPRYPSRECRMIGLRFARVRDFFLGFGLPLDELFFFAIIPS